MAECTKFPIFCNIRHRSDSLCIFTNPDSQFVTFAITVFVDMSLTPLGSDRFTVYSVSFVIPLTFIFTGIYDIFSSVASSL